MTSTISGGLEALRNLMTGPVLLPADADYDKARTVWNGEIDRRPAAVARVQSAGDVAAAVGFAREHRIELTVRGGGHNFGGAAVADGALMIDLSLLSAVVVDPVAKTARCGGGATLAQFDAATQEFGLAVTGGTISNTGVGGLTLGGGFGWLTSRMGLSCDNVIGAQVVTADARILHASETDNPDLFWAIRGGGGNFGVVTEFEFRLQPIGPLVNFAMFFWPLADATEALRTCRDTAYEIAATTGVLIGCLNAPPAPFVPEEYHFAPGVALMVAGFDTPEEHANLLPRIREKRTPAFEFVTQMPYTALQSMLDDSAPWGIWGYEKAHYLDDLSDDVIAAVVEHLPKKQSPLSFIPIFPLAGAFGLIPDDATAFGGSRAARWAFNIAGLAPTPELHAADRVWVRSLWEALQPYASSGGSYVNFMTDFDEDRVRASYGEAKYERLAQIKAIYDPDNVFHRNANIKPAEA